MGEMIFKVMLLAICVEAAIGMINPLLNMIEFKYQYTFLPYILSLVLGWVAVMLCSVNIFGIFGATGAGSYVASGIVVGRLSNYIHNVFGKVTHGLGDILSGAADVTLPKAQDE